MNPSDGAVQATNDDATCSKAYAVRKGYWSDLYMQYFCASPVSKSPEISRGYFARVQAFRAIVIAFIQMHNRSCQIINLGAGSDTLYFQLRDANILPRIFVEVDLSSNVHRKISTIRCRKLLPEIHESSNSIVECNSATNQTIPYQPQYSLVTESYAILSFDLRQSFDSFVNLCESLNVNLDKSLPTLFLAECVMVYMPPAQSSQLLKDISRLFPFGAFLHYEQVNMNDKFGSIMIDNFRARGCELPGLSTCQSLQEQERRFIQSGWKRAKAWTINEVYGAFSQSTRERIEKVEMLDDWDIMKQLFHHYCIVLAVNDPSVFPLTSLEESLSRIP